MKKEASAGGRKMIFVSSTENSEWNDFISFKCRSLAARRDIYIQYLSAPHPYHKIQKEEASLSPSTSSSLNQIK